MIKKEERTRNLRIVDEKKQSILSFDTRMSNEYIKYLTKWNIFLYKVSWNSPLVMHKLSLTFSTTIIKTDIQLAVSPGPHTQEDRLCNHVWQRSGKHTTAFFSLSFSSMVSSFSKAMSSFSCSFDSPNSLIYNESHFTKWNYGPCIVQSE